MTDPFKIKIPKCFGGWFESLEECICCRLQKLCKNHFENTVENIERKHKDDR